MKPKTKPAKQKRTRFTRSAKSAGSTNPARSAEAPQNSSLLQGWTAIAGFLGLPTATAQRWARTGMPVRKQGRFTVADKNELQQWLGRESHMPAPAQVVGTNTDLASALKQSISAALGRVKTR